MVIAAENSVPCAAVVSGCLPRGRIADDWPSGESRSLPCKASLSKSSPSRASPSGSGNSGEFVFAGNLLCCSVGPPRRESAGRRPTRWNRQKPWSLAQSCSRQDRSPEPETFRLRPRVKILGSDTARKSPNDVSLSANSALLNCRPFASALA